MELDQFEWIKPTERETVLVRLAIENYKDRENQRDEHSHPLKQQGEVK